MRTALHFVWMIVIARLLLPSDFGLVAMAAPFMMLANLMSGLGIGHAVIQRPILSHGELSNLYWVSLAIYTIAGALLMASAPLVEAFYGVPEVAQITLVYSAILVLNGAGAIHGTILLRRLKFTHQETIAFTSRLVGILAGLVTAWALRSFWALVVMQAAASICRLAMIWIVSDWIPGKFRRDVHIGGLLRFGANIAIARLMNFITDNVDTILIGKIWGQTALGFYDRAFKLLVGPTGRTTGAIAGPAKAIMSRLVSEPQTYRRAFLSLNRLALLAVAPGILWAVMLAGDLVPFLLGPGWNEVVPIFQAFGVLAVMRVMVVMFNWLFIAEGRSAEFRRWGIFRAAVIVTALVIGVQWGPVGVAAAYAGVVAVVLTPIHMVWVTRKSAVRLTDLLETLAIFTPALLLAAGGLQWLVASLSEVVAIKLALGLVVSYAATWGFVLIFPAGRAALTHGVRVARAGLSKDMPATPEGGSGIPSSD